MKRIALRVLIVAVSLSALLGCVALLSSSFGEIEVKVLFSTLIVAETSLLAMACAATMQRPFLVWLPKLGIAVAMLTTPLLLIGVWNETESESFWQVCGTLQVIAVAVAHGSLLLVARLRSARQWMLGATMVLNVVLVVLILSLIWEATQGGETYWRALGIVAILLSTGTILVWVFHRMDREVLARDTVSAGGDPQIRFCVACGASRIKPSADGSVCRRCGTEFRAEFGRRTAPPAPPVI